MIVVALREKIAVFDAITFESKFWISRCYPCTEVQPIGLGSRWLAYSDKGVRSFFFRIIIIRFTTVAGSKSSNLCLFNRRVFILMLIYVTVKQAQIRIATNRTQYAHTPSRQLNNSFNSFLLQALQSHQSYGGMCGTGLQSYTATMLNAAESVKKGLSIVGRLQH